MKNTELKGESHRATPDHNWTLEMLTAYVKERFTTHSDMREDLAALARRSAVELFKAGRALHFLRDKLKAQVAWEQWLKDNDIAKGTAKRFLNDDFLTSTSAEYGMPLRSNSATPSFVMAKPRPVTLTSGC